MKILEASFAINWLRQLSRFSQSPRVLLNGNTTDVWSGRQLSRRRALSSLVWIGFFLMVAVPTLLTAAYLGLVASNEFVSEARIVVRAGVSNETPQVAVAATASLMKGFGGGAGQAAGQQDGYIVTNYIQGRSIIDDLGGAKAIVEFYSRPDVDWLSRLPSHANFENIWKYWQHKVSATLDIPSGIVILEVRAFTRSDAEDLAKRVIAASEKLVNDMSERARSDALGQAQVEFAKAKQRVSVAQRELLIFRNNNELLDPMMSAGSVSEVLTGLIRDKLALENDIATTKGAMSSIRRPNAYSKLVWKA